MKPVRAGRQVGAGNRVVCNRLALLLALTLLAGCTEEPSETPTSGSLVVRGSDSALPLMQREAQTFMMLYPNSRIKVEGGGSRAGLAGIIDRSARVGVTSKDLDEEELGFFQEVREKPVTFKIAIDAVTLIVNTQNPVDALALDEARAIFTGKVVNWQAVRGRNKPILPVVQNPNSGTRRWFQQVTLKGEAFSSRVYQVNTVEEVLQTIREHPEAVGFLSMSRLDPSVKVLSIQSDPGVPPVEPSQASLLDHSYPLSRPIMLVTPGEAEGLASGFISYITSTPGQRIVADMGFLPATVPVTIRMP